MAVVGKGKEAVPFISELADVAHFSYAALCAMRLRYLFVEAECDKKFCEECLKIILVHVGLPKQVRESVFSIMHGMGIEQKDPLVHALLKDVAVTKYGAMRIAEDLVFLAIKDGVYDSRNRVLIHDICECLGLDWDSFEKFELSVVDSLHEEEHVLTEEEKKERDSKDKKRKIKRYALIGLATVGGGALLGLTGGLAAPLIAGGMGAIIGTAGATALASTAGVAIIGSLFGAAGAGLAGAKMKTRMGSLEEFEFERLTTGEDLHTTVAISGWLNNTCTDFQGAWLGLADSTEQYTLRYESEYLKQMGKAIDYLMDIAINMAIMEGLKYTVLAGVLAAIAWPMTLISAAAVIDNPWHVCMERSSQAGKQLAEILLARIQGKRPVNLIGFSIGARVIFHCLEELAKRKKSEGIIQNVVLLGAPVSGDAATWKQFSRVVAGRIVNGYSGGDWLLKFLYRTANVQLKIAGLGPIKWENRRMENFDLSEIIEGHLDYMKKIDEILQVVGVRTKERPISDDWEVVEKQDKKTELPKVDHEYYSVASVVRDMASKKNSTDTPPSNIVNDEFHKLAEQAKESEISKEAKLEQEKDIAESNSSASSAAQGSTVDMATKSPNELQRSDTKESSNISTMQGLNCDICKAGLNVNCDCKVAKEAGEETNGAAACNMTGNNVVKDANVNNNSVCNKLSDESNKFIVNGCVRDVDEIDLMLSEAQVKSKHQ